MVVKSSLALSLGLVGALSLVRFRTPIKEPEELAHLFLVSAVGLGFGAGQSVVTPIVFLVIPVLIVLCLSRTSVATQDEYNLMIDWREDDIEMKAILDVISRHTEQVEPSRRPTIRYAREVVLGRPAPARRALGSQASSPKLLEAEERAQEKNRALFTR